MTPIRILLAEMPRLLHDIIASVIAAQPDMELDVIADGRETLAEAIARTTPDVVIVGAGEAPPAQAVAPLLRQRVGLRMLAIAGDGREASMYELRPHVAPVADVSPDGLAAAIRDAVAGTNPSEVGDC